MTTSAIRMSRRRVVPSSQRVERWLTLECGGHLRHVLGAEEVDQRHSYRDASADEALASSPLLANIPTPTAAKIATSITCMSLAG